MTEQAMTERDQGSQGAASGDSAGRVRHPLDPLNGDEIRQAVAIVRRERPVTAEARFVSVNLNEPAKSQVAFADPAVGADADAVPRQAFVVLMEPREHMLYEAVVSLTDDSVVSWRPVPGAIGPVTLWEYAECQRVTAADPRVQAGLERRGITNPAQVLFEPWGIGPFTADEETGRRVMWTLLFYRERPDDNPYAKPIHGLHAVVDLDEMVVLRVEDLGVVPFPPGDGAYAADRVEPRRDGLKPLEIVQPDGPSFEVDGWEVRWQNWRFRVGFTAREGLVLHAVGYEDGDKVRPVIWRASVAELYIPYADPRPFLGYRNAFDIGEYGIGIMANSLEYGCDCLGEIAASTSISPDPAESHPIKNAICLHEEDFGICGSTGVPTCSKPRCAATGAWSSPSSRRSATTIRAYLVLPSRTGRFDSRSS